MAEFANTVDTITVLQWNCRSIFSKLDIFKFLVNQLNCDVFALCETWLTPDMNLLFPDFNIIRRDRSSRHGGVLLGIKKQHSFYRVDFAPMTGTEAVACQVTIRGKELSIASIYLPPNTANLVEIFRTSARLCPSHGCFWEILTLTVQAGENCTTTTVQP